MERLSVVLNTDSKTRKNEITHHTKSNKTCLSTCIMSHLFESPELHACFSRCALQRTNISAPQASAGNADAQAQSWMHLKNLQFNRIPT